MNRCSFPPSWPRGAYGFTVLELLIVLSVVAVLLGIGAVSVRPPTSQVFATSVQNLVLQARFEAVKRNAPVLVFWDEAEGEFVAALAGPSQWCADVGAIVGRSNAADLGRITVTTEAVGTRSLVWIPSGQARSCTRGAFGETFADIDDARTSRRITIGAAGRVVVQ